MKAAGLLQRKSPQRRVLGIGLQRSSQHQQSQLSNANDVSMDSMPEQKFSKKIQDSAVCRSPKNQNMQSESERSEQSYMLQEKSIDNSLQIIQNNFNKPQTTGSAPNQKQPQRKVFGQQRDTIKQYSPSMRLHNKLNNQMQQRAEDFKNAALG